MSLPGAQERLPVSASPAGRPALLQAPRLYAPFLRLALLFTLLVGSPIGAVQLLVYYGDLGSLPIAFKQVHGHVQLLGFISMFICGIAYHLVPRFSGVDLPAPGLARWTAVLLGAGVLLRALGQPLAFHAAGRAAAAASGALELGAGAVFAALAITTLHRAGPRTGWEMFVASAAGWFGVACATSAGSALWIAASSDAAAPATLVQPFIEAALFGFVLQWIMGLYVETGPSAWRLGRARQLLLIAAFLLVNAGTILAVAGATSAGAMRDAGEVVRAAGILAYLGAVARRGGEGPAHDTSLALIRTALVWLFVHAAAAAFVYGRALAFGEEPNALVADALRHLFTLGVAVQFCAGMSTRLVPSFGGVRLEHPRLRVWVLVLLNAAVALRSLEAVAGLGGPVVLRAVALAGPLGYAAIALWGYSIWRTLDRTRRREEIHARAAARRGRGSLDPRAAAPQPTPV